MFPPAGCPPTRKHNDVHIIHGPTLMTSTPDFPAGPVRMFQLWNIMPELELARARSWSAECQGAYVPTFWRPLYTLRSRFHIGILYREGKKPKKNIDTLGTNCPNPESTSRQSLKPEPYKPQGSNHSSWSNKSTLKYPNPPGNAVLWACIANCMSLYSSIT